MRAVNAERDADVVVVGAGLAGLAAARDLLTGGASVLVVEARDRVGGRVLNAPIAGAVVEAGGQWVGPTQDRVLALIEELALETFPTFEEGHSLLELDGQVRRYSGTIPKVGPLTLLDIAQARFRLERKAKRLDLEAPWAGARSADLDSITLGDWVAREMRTETARKLLRLAARTVWGADLDEMSLLHALIYMRGAGGLDPLIDTEGGAQQDRIVGGSGLLTRGLADRLGDRILLDFAVTAIRADGGRTVVSDGSREVSGRRVIVAVPTPLRAAIRYEGIPLSAAHLALPDAAPQGHLIKCVAAYSEPFWRQRGASGEAISDAGAVCLTFDNSPPGGSPGLLLGFVGGPDAVAFSALGPSERRSEVLETFARLFGEQARDPIDYLEQDWSAEDWSAGGPTFVLPPRSWSRYGRAFREPAGAVHWAGTETATRWAGFMDGAVSSGERAAREALDAL